MRKIFLFIIALTVSFSSFSQQKITGKSDPITVKYDLDYVVDENTNSNKPPVFKMISPKTAKSNPYTFKVEITDEDGIRIVTIDGIEADVNGKQHSAKISLEPGENSVSVKVLDSKGDQKTKNFTVTLDKISSSWGNYALFFAAENYENMARLTKPKENAKDIGNILAKDYNFDVEIVNDPNSVDIFDKISEYSKKFTNNQLDQNGQLLIFFSGHGIDKYFMPIGADKSSTLTLLKSAVPYTALSDEINKLQCKHIIVVIDACYSKSFVEATKGDIPRSRYNELSKEELIIKNFQNNKTRLFFTSDAEGAETPDNSDLAKKFIDALESKGGDDFILRFDELNSYLKNAKPKGLQGSFKDNKTDSDFLFIYDGD